MSTVHIEPESPSWTTTKVIAVIVAILTAGYMLPWAIAAVRDVPHWSVFWVNLLLGSSIKWNFTKFLVAPDGTTVTRYAPKTEPAELTEDIVAVLDESTSA